MADFFDLYKDLPNSPGVYFFKDSGGKILYIGKAINLRRRVSSYFQKRPADARLEDLAGNVAKIDCQKTESAVEALILEANLVKKYQPFYNIKLKDDKSFVNIAVSKEEFPKIFVIRPGVKRLYKKIKIARFFGPYTSAKTARAALKILRKIFPFRGLEKTCQAARFYKEIMEISENKERYDESIKNIILFLKGKKKRVINNLNKKMESASRKKEYEEAAKIRNQIFALRHIQDVALLKELDWAREPVLIAVPYRIEAYDISNIFGQYAAGGMAVFTDGKIDANEYRHFKIKGDEFLFSPFSKGGSRGISDTIMLKEILTRRFGHKEWTFPDLIIIDGGMGQLNIAKSVLKSYNLNIPAIAIAKGQNRKGENLFMTKGAPLVNKKMIVRLRDEAHRFAINYHRKLKRKGLLE